MMHFQKTAPLFLILTLLSISNPQSIQINDITNNAGALILQKGEGRVIAGYDRLLHVIDLTEFGISISIIDNIVGNIQNSSSEFIEIIKHKVREIKTIYYSLNRKHSRNRKSLDFLGSTIKFITGNLDAEDLLVINSNLDEIRKSGNALIKQNNRQIKINSKFENRISLINRQIRDQQNTIDKIAKQEDSIVSENQKILLALRLDSFLENLKSIEYAIILAKTNIISKLILSTNEIDSIMRELSEQGLEISSLDEGNNYLTTTVLYKGSSLIIVINIPRLLPETYKKVIIEPLPLFNRTVTLSYKEVFVNSDGILAITSTCLENSKTTICERKQLVEISDNPCEASLIRGHHGECPFSDKPTSLETRIIAPGVLLVITVHQDVPINSTCGIETKMLTGIHLVTFRNCSLYIRNQLFENYELQFDHPSILPSLLTNIKALHVERQVNISALHDLHIKNRQQLATIDTNYKLGCASLITIITLLIAFMVFRFIKYRRVLKFGDCSGRAKLKEGRVNDETTLPTIETMASGLSAETRARTRTDSSAISMNAPISTPRHTWTTQTARQHILGQKLGQ